MWCCALVLGRSVGSVGVRTAGGCERDAVCDNGIAVQMVLVSAHGKKRQRGIFSTLSCSTLCFLAGTVEMCNNIYIQMLTVIFHPGERRCHLEVLCMM